ncbi:MAG TPA: HAMP domain-containing sensor histidine kinase [Asticcacaulis sp.]|nr:HAMP domain-containing sensor histidine kinase [Asticcacaulis sp.]
MFDPGKPIDRPPGRLPPRKGGEGARVPQWKGFYGQRLARALSVIASAAVVVGWRIFDVGRRFLFSLTGQLAITSLVFVVAVEVMILIPSLAHEQESWLNDRIRQAEIASQAVDTSQTKTVTPGMSRQLLRSTGTKYLAILNNDVRSYRLYDPDVVVPDKIMDLRQAHKDIFADAVTAWAPWRTLLGAPGRLIHLQAPSQVRPGNQIIEIVVPADPLKEHLKASLVSSLRVSFMVALAAGVFMFGGLSLLIVRPIRRLTYAMQRFKTNPEDTTETPHVSGRLDEIGQIENELVSMQEEVRNALRSRARLAALGQAVSKINHDLRNMLTSAQMASDRLSAASADPTVAKALPRLERALDRALSLAQNVLTYGKSDERAPVIQIIKLKELAEAAAEDSGLCLPGATGEGVRFALKASKGFFLEADPEQLHRLLVNLMRNARQAIEHQPNRRTLGRVTLTAVKTSENVILILGDNGPGIPEKAREKLFQPFTSSSTPGGTGLGLAIARELAQLHGGDVRLLQTGADGTSFEVRLPLKG